MYRYLSVMAATAALSMVMAGTPALAQTASCGDFSGAAFGLCNAYCEAMACGSDNQQATENACMKVKSKFDALELDPLPCIATGNTAPVVDLNGEDPGIDTTATFVSFGDAVPIALNVAITDDGTVITSATITLKNPVAGENETLALTSQGLIFLEGLNDGAGGTAVFDPDADPLPVLFITGTGSLNQYEDLIQQVVYDNGVDAPNLETTDRTIDIMVTDDANAKSVAAVSALIIDHGCPCSSFNSEAVTTPAILVMFSPTEERCIPSGTDACYRGALCVIMEHLDSGSHSKFSLIVSADSDVFSPRFFRFETQEGIGCRADYFTNQTRKEYRDLRHTPLSETSLIHPLEALSTYTLAMHAACRARIPIQIERLRATFYVGGVDFGGAASCAPI